ncbi:MAG: response regulator [Hyphomicrobiales bacterium]
MIQEPKMLDSKGRIIVCDDEPHLREMVGEYLGERGYSITQAADAQTMHLLMKSDVADLIILDVNMPGEDGLSALRTLRQTSDVPVIMLTATAEVIDRVLGLEFGADDYLAKPVDLRELEARIKSTLRRHLKPGATVLNNRAASANISESAAIQFGHCILNIGGAKLFGSDENEIQLTAMEFNLLRVFAENRGRVLSRDQLLEQAHDKDWEPFDRSIDLHICRLRKKIEQNPTKPTTIRTVRGMGYIFD